VLRDRHGPLGNTADLFTTLQLEPPPRKGPFFLSVFGRLQVERAVAAEELRAINQRMFPVWQDSYQDEGASWGVASLERLLVGDTDRLVFALMGSVGLLLLMATANAANLLLARVRGRRRELAVRVAMGASRPQLVGYLLAESAILAFGGMSVGIAVAWGAIQVMPAYAAGYVPRLEEVSLSSLPLAFAAILSVGSAALFGLVSALGGSGEDLGQTLRAGGRGATLGVRQQRAQQLLVVAQLAIAVPLLAGAGLLASSLVRLNAIDPGFETERLVSVPVPLGSGRYSEESARRAFWDEVGTRLESLPGVSSVGLGNGRPPTQVGMINNFDLEDRPTPPGVAEPAVPWVIVDNGYFEALGIVLLEGRLFEPSDLDSGAPVVLVDEAWARRFFPGEEVIGRRMVSGGCTTCPLTTVVGVVGTVPYLGLHRADEGAVYSPGGRSRLATPTLHLRTVGDPRDVIPLARAEIREVDSSIPLTQFSSGDELLSESLARPRQLTALLGSFSLIALVLAAVGLYGIVAYRVQQRRGDIAVRLALGGSPFEVFAMVMRRGLSLVATGLVVGVVGALTFTRVLSDLLYDIEPTDPTTLAAVSALLLLVSVVACGVPGRKAVCVDPVTALREEG
jgi:predicted permease